MCLCVCVCVRVRVNVSGFRIGRCIDLNCMSKWKSKFAIRRCDEFQVWFVHVTWNVANANAIAAVGLINRMFHNQWIFDSSSCAIWIRFFRSTFFNCFLLSFSLSRSLHFSGRFDSFARIECWVGSNLWTTTAVCVCVHRNQTHDKLSWTNFSITIHYLVYLTMGWSKRVCIVYTFFSQQLTLLCANKM